MKLKHSTLLAFLLVFLPQLHLQAQSSAWHPIPNHHTYAYTFQEPLAYGESLMATRSTTSSLEGADSAYYLYRQVRMNTAGEVRYNCQNVPFTPTLLADLDHVFGQKVLVGQGGMVRFIFSSADTFLLQAHAGTGQSWSWHGSVTATVDSISLGQVLGEADSLKHISFSNGQRMVLSRSHGLVEIPNFHPGGDPSLYYKIWGIHERALGRRIPRWQDYFVLSPGDRYTRKHLDHNIGLGWSRRVTLTEVHLDSIHIGPDTITHFNTHLVKEQQTGTDVDGPYDTTIYSGPSGPHIEHYLRSAEIFDLLPYQYPGPHIFTDYNIRPTSWRVWPEDNSRVLLSGFYSDVEDSCAMGLSSYSPPINIEHLTGLGHYHIDEIAVYYYYWDSILCFALASGNYGACPNLLSAPSSSPEAAHFTVSPNPSGGLFEVRFGQALITESRLEVLTPDGRVVRTQSLRAGTPGSTVDLRDQPSGVYLLRVAGTAKRLVVLR